MKTKNQIVRIFNFETQQVTEIPACELGPQMVKARIQGREGEFFVDITKTKGIDMTRKFDPPREFQKAIRHCMDLIKDVDPRTYGQHESALCAESNPLRALLLYFHCITTYRKFSSGNNLDQGTKNELWMFIIMLSFNGREMIFHTFRLCRLKRSVAEQVVEFYCHHDPRPEFFRLFNENMLLEDAA